jgi:endonuclease YncB( thermonuclease family)
MQFNDRQMIVIAIACALGIGVGVLLANTYGRVEPSTEAFDQALAEQLPVAPPAPQAPDLGVRGVDEVIGGDVVMVEGVGVVRLLGVDTTFGPDGKPIDPALAKATLEQVLAGKQVSVICDPATADTNFKDSNGAWLAYLMLEDGVLANTELIARGTAVADLTRPYGRKDEIVMAERDARWNGRGLWAATAKLEPVAPTDVGRMPGRTLPPLPPPVEAPKPGKDDVLVTKDGRFHRPSCRLGKGGIVLPGSDARGKNYLACPECFVSPRMKV